ncbi:hypothetical protein [Streptomyces sp. URMC 123]|uniref:hypothetical protein n=1 Tax=Streptomyces sp. URMC 123 TaxID=3423403 RepID=UPI003F1CC44C
MPGDSAGGPASDAEAVRRKVAELYARAGGGEPRRGRRAAVPGPRRGERGERGERAEREPERAGAGAADPRAPLRARKREAQRKLTEARELLAQAPTAAPWPPLPA